MGKGHKNHGKPHQKPNNKYKQRSAENLKELKRLQNIKGRGQTSDFKDKPKDKRDRNNSRNQKNFNNRGSNQKMGRNDREHSNHKFDNNKSNKKFDRNNSRQRDNSQGRFKNDKTKQINKPINKKLGKGNRFEDEKEQVNQPLKGNPLFQIIPQGMDDEFAALGQSDQQQNIEQYSGQQVQDEGQFDQQNEQLQGEGQDDEQIQGQQNEDQEFDQQQEDEEQGQGQQFQEQAQQAQQGQQAQQAQQAQQGQQGQQGQLMLPQGVQGVDISVISLKIQQTIQILMNVQRLGQGKPRKYHIEQLKKLIHRYYGYNFELIAHFLDFFTPSEMVQFFEANQTQRPLTIRTNTLKTKRKELAQSLIQRGVNLDPLADWSKVGIKIYQTKVPIGATPEYLAGQYMLQSASSLLPVIALDPQVGQKVLDMASAPGGKTTYIAQLMKNTGCIFANDLKKERLRALQFNLYRLGVTNTAVTCKDGRKFPSIFPATFDRVLLDAPCTGLGIISKDHSIKSNRLLIDIYKNSHLQKQLLLAAIDCCKVNGTIVYSTCSVSPLENEEVVNYALKRRFVKIADCGIEVGEQGLTKFVEKRFHVDLKKTRRIYPHVHNMDGFYVAKLIKVGKGKKQVKQQQQKEESKIENHQEQIQ